MKQKLLFLLLTAFAFLGMPAMANASTFTVNISDASQVSLLQLKWDDLDYHTGSNIYSFDGESTYVKIKGTKAETPFYSVTLNGSTTGVTQNKIQSNQPVTYVIEPVENGDVIDVVVDNTAELTVTITAPEGFIREYAFNSDDYSSDLSNYSDGKLTLKAPSSPFSFTFKGNVTDYNVNSWSVNGTVQTVGFYGTKTFSAQQENLDLVFNVADKTEYIHPVIDVDHANRVSATLDGLTLNLVDGANTLDIPADGVNNKKLVLKAASDNFFIKSVTDNFGISYADYYGRYDVDLTADMVLTVSTGEVVYDSTAVFYVNTDECFAGNSTFSSFSFSNDDFVSAFVPEERPAALYTEFKFAEAFPVYTFSWYSSKYAGLDSTTWDEYYNVWVFANDQLVKSKQGTYQGTSYQIDLFENEVVKVFFQADKPEFKTVTIIGGDLVSITKDLITPVSQQESSFSALPGTQINISDIAASLIKVNGEAMEVDENGNLVLSVGNDDMSIEIIDKSTGIETLGEQTKSFDVYNLQGISLMRGASLSDVDNLAPGAYIVNGRKVVKR